LPAHHWNFSLITTLKNSDNSLCIWGFSRLSSLDGRSIGGSADQGCRDGDLPGQTPPPSTRLQPGSGRPSPSLRASCPGTWRDGRRDG